MRISTEVPTPTSEVDIGICHTNLCKVVAAANDSAFLPGKKVNPSLLSSMQSIITIYIGYSYESRWESPKGTNT